jgi:hypothetical protein
MAWSTQKMRGDHSAPIKDTPALPDAILALARDPGRRAALGRAARELIAPEFTAADALDRAESLFRSIAGNARHAPADDA